MIETRSKLLSFEARGTFMNEKLRHIKSSVGLGNRNKIIEYQLPRYFV